jgi:uncharacterized membrane protein YhiD involved in acid resistance
MICFPFFLLSFRLSIACFQMLELQEFTTRLLVALFAGFIIGFERQWHHKSAGLRTNTLVSTGSAIYVLISIFLTRGSMEMSPGLWAR